MAGLTPFNRRGFGTPRFDGLGNMIDSFFNDSGMPNRNLSYDTFKLDIKENDKEYDIDAEMPGIKKDEINIELADGILTILVQREENIENKEDKEDKVFIHRERSYSSMQRSVYLADADNEENNGILTRLDNGILKITVPKKTKMYNK